jgi:hypothetical protein
VEKSDEHVMSVDVIKKADEIEKLAGSVKDKMKARTDRTQENPDASSPAKTRSDWTDDPFLLGVRPTSPCAGGVDDCSSRGLRSALDRDSARR